MISNIKYTVWRCPPLRGNYIANLMKISSTTPASNQTFERISSFFILFAHSTKIAVTHKYVLQSG